MMSESNDGLVAEYVEVLKAKMNDFVEEAVALKARLQYSEKISNDAQSRVVELQNEIGKREADLASVQEQLAEEKKKPAKEIEVIKEVEVKVSDDESLKAENEFLKKEIASLERKIKKLKESQQEMRNGNSTETEAFRNSQFSTDYQ